MKASLFLVAGACLALVVSGCESTQSRSAALESEGAGLVKQKTFDVGTENRQIDVVEKVALTDVNGSAVAATRFGLPTARRGFKPLISGLFDPPHVGRSTG